MKYGIQVPQLGDFADAALLASLAKDAEDAGWDGFFVWDTLVSETGLAAVDPWIATAVMALQTRLIRVGVLVTPLPRRRPAKVARETVALDRLSNGRLIVGFGTGGGPHEWDYLGDEPDARRRGDMLDEGLAVLTGLWRGEPFSYGGTYYKVAEPLTFLPAPLQQPRIPVWIAGGWPNPRPARRAARWDGYFPIMRDGFAFDAQMTLLQAAEAVQFVQAERARLGLSGPFDFVHYGISSGKDTAADSALAGQYAAAGCTWWMENISPWVYGWDEHGAWPVAAMRERILAGPPK